MVFDSPTYEVKNPLDSISSSSTSSLSDSPKNQIPFKKLSKKSSNNRFFRKPDFLKKTKTDDTDEKNAQSTVLVKHWEVAQ